MWKFNCSKTERNSILVHWRASCKPNKLLRFVFKYSIAEKEFLYVHRLDIHNKWRNTIADIYNPLRKFSLTRFTSKFYRNDRQTKNQTHFTHPILQFHWQFPFHSSSFLLSGKQIWKLPSTVCNISDSRFTPIPLCVSIPLSKFIEPIK